MTTFTGRAARLTDAGVAAAAQSIGTTPRLLRTVMAVETAGRGFDSQGRLRMLFEPGTFFHRVPEAKRDAACQAGCALSSMVGHHYPSDSYPLLAIAMKIDATAALESASWGLPQVMGFNHGMAGFVSAEAMIADFVDDENAHVMALAKFLKAAHLVDALNAHRWDDVARGYNGLAYAKNAYDTKLATAYAAIKGATAAAVATAVPPRVPTPELDLIRGAVVRAAAEQAREALVKPTAPSLPIGGSTSTTTLASFTASQGAGVSVPPVPSPGPVHVVKVADSLTGWRAVVTSVRTRLGMRA